MMNEMMEQTLTIGTAHKAALPGWPAAGKTGTSQDFRDAWFIGYTAHLVTGVWLGNDDGTPTKKVTGGGLPVEIWSRFMRGAHQGVPVAALPGPPAGGLFSGLFGGNAPAPCNGRHGAAGADPIAPATRQPARAAASTAGCSIICSAAAGTSAVWPRAPAARALISTAASVAQPIAATAPASGQALLPSSEPTTAPHSAATALLHEAEQRGGRARAFRKRRHGAGDRLRQHHAETGEIERHRQHQRGGGGQSERDRQPPCRGRRPPSPRRRGRACGRARCRITSRAASVVPAM